MSQIFDALKTIRAKRDADGEYTRVAIRVREGTPVRQPLPSSRWNPGIARGLLMALTGVIVAAFGTALWWDWPTQDSSAPPVVVAAAPAALPTHTASDAGRTEPAPMAMVAVAAPTPEPAVAEHVPVVDPPAAADHAAVVDHPAVADHAAAAEPVQAPPSAGDFWVQLGAFKEHDNATRFHADVARKRANAVVRPGRRAPSWVVAVGPYMDERAAADARTVLVREGLTGFVTRGNR